MLKAIEIENFKAFGERQRIELRPITLLFGPNSGGKSTVIHALHYLREILLDGDPDAHRTGSGGDGLDLGGIRKFIHGQELGRPIRFKVDFDLSGVELHYYFEDADRAELRDSREDQVRGLVTSASVELELDTSGVPFVTRFASGINGQPLAEYTTRGDLPFSSIQKINWLNPVLLVSNEERSQAQLLRAIENQLARRGSSRSDLGDAESIFDSVGVLADAFEAATGRFESNPTFQIARVTNRPLLPDLTSPLVLKELYGIPSGNPNEAKEFCAILSMLLLGPVHVLRSRLYDFRYVGPLRELPERFDSRRKHRGYYDWSNGMAAWGELGHGCEEFRSSTSDWLELSDRLDTGYRIEVKTVQELDTALVTLLADPDRAGGVLHLKKLLSSLQTHTRIFLRDTERNLELHPRDVGVGLSQVIPVVAAILARWCALIAIEQPELHLHPRQQAALGDLLIEGARAPDGRQIIAETHSEHLILRVLRRIRETTGGVSVAGRALSPQDLRIQYIRREGTVSKVHTIDVDVNGDLVDPWPDDFFEQDFKERFS